MDIKQIKEIVDTYPIILDAHPRSNFDAQLTQHLRNYFKIKEK